MSWQERVALPSLAVGILSAVVGYMQLREAEKTLSATNSFQLQSSMLSATEQLLHAIGGEEDNLPIDVAYDLWSARYEIVRRSLIEGAAGSDALHDFIELQCRIFDGSDFGIDGRGEFRQDQLRLDCEELERIVR